MSDLLLYLHQMCVQEHSFVKHAHQSYYLCEFVFSDDMMKGNIDG